MSPSLGATLSPGAFGKAPWLRVRELGQHRQVGEPLAKAQLEKMGRRGGRGRSHNPRQTVSCARGQSQDERSRWEETPFRLKELPHRGAVCLGEANTPALAFPPHGAASGTESGLLVPTRGRLDAQNGRWADSIAPRGHHVPEEGASVLSPMSPQSCPVSF